MASVVIAPDKFKGVISAPAAARAIATGVRRARPDAEIIELPMADGGEGTLEIIVEAMSGQRRSVRATGPLGDPLEVPVGLVREATAAVIELAAVSGYSLIPEERRDPLKTTTYGLGEVIRAAVETEIEEIILALGGSATVDGGAGMMQALGMTFYDADGRSLDAPLGGGNLSRIARVAWDRPPENLADVRFTIAVDVLNPASGPNGAATVFGPQKGADAHGVALLEKGMTSWANVLERSAGRSIRNEPGTGAAGGVALPLLALLSAQIVPGVDLVCEANRLADRIGAADLVITGEGRLDRQSLMGKVVGAVARMARSVNVPCVAMVGATGEGAEECMHLLDDCITLDAPLPETERRLTELAQQMAMEWI